MRIVREEMDASGAQLMRMPIILPAEPWRATGRWDLYGDLLFRLQDRHGRDMPWRRTRDPWAILVSELMLQQTQVARVIPKYEAFLARFPTVAACAAPSRGSRRRVLCFGPSPSRHAGSGRAEARGFGWLSRSM